MSQPIIQIEGLSKLYTLGTLRKFSIKDAVEHWWNQLTGKKVPDLKPRIRFNDSQRGEKPNTFWALKDINLEVKQGEVVGVIGRNGAGKSTLLKILSRITEPTTGRAVLRGRVASLLEVGTGFHPDLTGRENIYLNGAILGMRRREIDRKFDAIVQFAEIENFLDTAVKHYSSGMYVRLAFAVAAHLEPEILIVDEVLAVGDAAFQKKCLGKMEDVAKTGRTVLFVSHNMAAVKNLCRNVVMLDQGKIFQQGEPDQVIASYLNSGQKMMPDGQIPADYPRSGTGEAQILKVRLLDESGNSVNQVYLGQACRVVMTVEVKKEVPDAVLGVHINSIDGTCFASCYNTDEARPVWALQKGVYEIAVEIQTTLVPRHYVLDLGVFRSNGWDIDYVERAFYFEALNVATNSKDTYPWSEKHGYIRPAAKWFAPKITARVSSEHSHS